MTYEDRLKNMWSLDFDAQMYSSLLIIAILLVLTVVVGIQARHVYKKKLYLQRPHDSNRTGPTRTYHRR